MFWLFVLFPQLIDPYWTYIPVMILHYCTSHPRADADPTRQFFMIALVWFWSLRLTHSYFRREEWLVGHSEDWRYSDMRKDLGGHWWWISFFAVYFIQQLMLVGLCLPMFGVFFARFYGAAALPWSHAWDTPAALMCLVGVLIAFVADTQLYEFVTANKRRVANGASRVLVLETGLWRYSRHPNHFGEQLWWWGVALLGISAVPQQLGWVAMGTLFNSALMLKVTWLVEARMVKDSARAAAFQAYARRTSMWLPCPPSKDPAHAD